MKLSISFIAFHKTPGSFFKTTRLKYIAYLMRNMRKMSMIELILKEVLNIS
jgi:hypothetical protein